MDSRNELSEEEKALAVRLGIIAAPFIGWIIYNQFDPFADFIKYATVVVAAIAASLVYLQYRTAHYKLKLDLFEKRFAVYKRVREYISQVINANVMDFADFVSFQTETSQKDFLFDKDVIAFIDSLYQKSVDLNVKIQQRRSDGADEAEKQRLSSEINDALLWVVDQNQEATRLFQQYLGFKNIK